MDHVYRSMRSLNITDKFISKTKDHIYNTILLSSELNLPVISSADLFEHHFVFQMKTIVGGLTDKSEYHIGRDHQDGKRMTWCLIQKLN